MAIPPTAATVPCEDMPESMLGSAERDVRGRRLAVACSMQAQIVNCSVYEHVGSR